MSATERDGILSALESAVVITLLFSDTLKNARPTANSNEALLSTLMSRAEKALNRPLVLDEDLRTQCEAQARKLPQADGIIALVAMGRNPERAVLESYMHAYR